MHLKCFVHIAGQGNIRELRNFCENIVVLKRGSEVTEYDLDLKYQVKAGGSQLPRDRGLQFDLEQGAE